MTTLIYLSGLILSFIMGRYVGRMMHKQNEWEYSWGWVALNILLAFASWFAFVAFCLIYVMERETITDTNGKPKIKIPNWL